MYSEFLLFPHPKWTNLKIYPEIARLEREIGLLNDLADCFKREAINVTFQINSPFKDFFNERLHTFEYIGTILIVYTDNLYLSVNKFADILITTQDNLEFFKKITFTDKFIYFSEFCYSFLESQQLVDPIPYYDYGSGY